VRVPLLRDHTSNVLRILDFLPVPGHRVQNMEVVEGQVAHSTKNVNSSLDLDDTGRMALARHPMGFVDFDGEECEGVLLR